VQQPIKMSGRGRGRNTSHGRQSSVKENEQMKTSHLKSSKNTLEDNMYYLGSVKQAADYEKTTDYLINHIKKNFDFGNDIGTTLEDLNLFDIANYKPSLKISIQDEATAKLIEDKQFEIEFKAEFDGYMKRRQSLEVNISKSYAFLWDQCAKGMQNKIEARYDYQQTIKGNPIELLKAVKQHALNYQEHRYEMSIILEAIRALITCKQKENENLQDYTKRFKTSRDVLDSHMGGPIELTKFMKKMDEYDSTDPTKIEKCRTKAYQQFLAFLYIDNIDRAKYGSLLNGLQTQISLGNNQYPVSITEANNVLSSHRFDMTNKAKFQMVKKDSDNRSSTEEQPELSFAQLEGRCYCCGKQGHKSPTCRFKAKPKEQWAINKAKQREQSHVSSEGQSTMSATRSATDTQSSRGSTTSSVTSGWSGANVQFYQSIQMRDIILLDNQSTVSLFCNSDMVEGIRKVDEELRLATNGGELCTNLKATVPGFGDVWYNSKAITNIFSFAEMEDKHKITYDSSNEKAFIVHLPDKDVRFKRNHNGLYYFKKGTNVCATNAAIESIEENKLMFTNRQIQKAKVARQLYHSLGTPSVKDFKTIIITNSIKNLPVTLEDIKTAEAIYGPDIGALKGKTTRKKPYPVVLDYIEVPKELIATHQNVTLCMDGMNINGIPFLTTVSRNLMYRTAEWIPNQSAQSYRSVLDNVFRIYNRAGFKITTIHCDNEFQPLLDELQSVYNVKMNYANPQEHVPEAERNNRVIKERFRAMFHRLPFDKMPKIMIKVLAMECTKKLNFFPPKGGVSSFYSPRMILHQENLDFNKHCAIQFGAYVQAHHEPSPQNAQHPRTIDCIYLRYVDNIQGGHHLLDIRTGRTIKRRNVTQVPITQNIIDIVHAMATHDGITSGLKIKSKSGITLFDSSWIAGVDYKIDSENKSIKDDGNEMHHEMDEMDPDTLAEILQDRPATNSFECHTEEVNPTEVIGLPIEEPIPNNEDDTSEASEHENVPDEKRTRSGRVTRPPDRMNLHQCHLQTQGHSETEYAFETAKVIAKNISGFNAVMTNNQQSFVETYSLKKGLKHFGTKGYEAAIGEMKQLHERAVFIPVDVNTLTQQEKKRAMDSLIFLVEKRDGRVKARTCANGSTQRGYINKEDSASPTALTEAIILTATIEAREQRDVMTVDIPNAFVQTDIIKQNNERVMLKIKGALVDMLVALDQELYGKYVVFDNNEKILYVEVLKALYGMLQASLLFYKKLRKDLEEIGFEVNPYDPCVANRIINGKQHTITWHVDDLKSSHQDPKVNDEFHKWLDTKYGDNKIGKVKAVRGNKHEYLGMILDYSNKGELQLDMKSYIKKMLDEFPEQVTGSKSPWNENLFKEDTNSALISKDDAEQFHKFVAKALFASKRARPDILPAIAYLCTRVKSPNQNDWIKLKKLMSFLMETQNDVLTLTFEDGGKIKWYLDAAFAVHKDLRSHTGAVMSLGKGAIQSVSTKQKVNTRSSTEAELVSMDDILSKVLWTKLFLESQGYKSKQNIIFRDNQSSMKLEENGKTSSGKRTRHFEIKYFYITDLIERKQVSIEYCSTNSMVADYMTKPLTGAKFKELRKVIMNLT
jgi:Reverse transcriptase (RNA-dependent DNA polymerase)